MLAAREASKAHAVRRAGRGGMDATVPGANRGSKDHPDLWVHKVHKARAARTGKMDGPAAMAKTETTGTG